MRDGREKLSDGPRTAERRWVREHRDVRVSEIPRQELGDWVRTKSYERRDLERAVHELPEVRRRLDQGATPDEFSRLRRSSNEREQLLGRTYQGFYGQDRIRLDRTGDGRIDVVNGRHRIELAREAGLDRVPAEVSRERRAEKPSIPPPASENLELRVRDRR